MIHGFKKLLMKNNKIIVRTESSNLWWGIYGFCDKTGWEDLNLFDENNELIGGVCLNAKSYLQTEMESLRDDIEEKKYVEAIENYLEDNTCHYWYYYNNHNEEVPEVPYTAPLNAKGAKPRFIDIWHPDKGIGISTIKTGVKAFAKRHLGIENCKVEVKCGETFEESIKSFRQNEEMQGRSTGTFVKFTDELVNELSKYWKKTAEEVLEKLKNSME